MEWKIQTVWQRLKDLLELFFRPARQRRPGKQEPQVKKSSETDPAPNDFMESELDASGSNAGQPDTCESEVSQTLDDSPVADTAEEELDEFSLEGLAPSGKSVFKAKMALERAKAALEQAENTLSDLDGGETAQTDEIVAMDQTQEEAEQSIDEDNLVQADGSESINEEPETNHEITEETEDYLGIPVSEEPDSDGNSPPTPGKYHPKRRKPKTAAPQSNQDPEPDLGPEETAPEASQSNERSQPSDILVRVKKKRTHLSLDFLPRRAEGMADTILAHVSPTSEETYLESFGEDWYETTLPDASAALQEGFFLEAKQEDGSTAKWLLRGREIYVLGGHPDFSGWIQTPKLSIDEPQVVLCTESIKDQAVDVICSTGSPAPTELRETGDLPEGWVLLEGVAPKRPAEQGEDESILDVLKPRPEAKISLIGGIKIDRGTWLASHPPQIHVTGEHIDPSAVKIDGKTADRSAEGEFTASGCFELGDHEIFVSGTTKAYSIIEPDAIWQQWPAHRLPSGQSQSATQFEISVCGPLVWGEAADRKSQQPLFMPASHPVLIGASPGQIFYCKGPSHNDSGRLIGFPNFKPIWALPTNPLRCPKSLSVRNISKSADCAPVPPKPAQRSRTENERLKSWSRIIREAGYRHLKVSPNDETTIRCWRQFQRCAKSVNKAIR